MWVDCACFECRFTVHTECSRHCACSANRKSYDPVCGSDNLTYFSGCFAGCTQFVNGVGNRCSHSCCQLLAGVPCEKKPLEPVLNQCEITRRNFSIVGLWRNQRILPRDDMLSAVYAMPIPSVRLFVRHTCDLYQNGWTYHRNSFTIW